MFNMTYLNFVVDVNECDLKTYTCDPNAECENIVGSYYCICNAGYTGSGKSCTCQYQKLITYHLAHISYLYMYTLMFYQFLFLYCRLLMKYENRYNSSIENIKSHKLHFTPRNTFNHNIYTLYSAFCINTISILK